MESFSSLIAFMFFFVNIVATLGYRWTGKIPEEYDSALLQVVIVVLYYN